MWLIISLSLEMVVALCEPLGDDPVNFRRKAQANMSRADFHMLDVGRLPIDASLPSDDPVGTRIDRHYRCFKRHGLVAPFYFGGDCFDIDAAPTIPFSDHSVFRTADDRCAEGDDLPDEIRLFPRQLAREITAEAPADERDFLLAAPGERSKASQETR